MVRFKRNIVKIAKLNIQSETWMFDEWEKNDRFVVGKYNFQLEHNIMEDILIHFAIWGGIFFVLILVLILKQSNNDIKTQVWLRLITSVCVLLIGNILLYKFYRSINSGPGYKIVALLLIFYACLDIPAKIAGVYYKRKLAFNDFSINLFDKQIDKLGLKPLILSFILAILQIAGCTQMKAHYNEKLKTNGIETQALVKQKTYERMYKNSYDSVVYLQFDYNNRRYEVTALYTHLNPGDSAKIHFDPSNLGNSKLIIKENQEIYPRSINCIKIDISEKVKRDSAFNELINGIKAHH